MAARKRFAGPAAVSAAAIASLVGAPSASAQDCQICGDLAPPGTSVAFSKHILFAEEFLKTPGKVEFAYVKMAIAFSKDVFGKD